MINEEKVKAATMDILQYAAEVMRELGFDDYTEVGMSVGSALGGEMLTEYKKHDFIRNSQMKELREKVEKQSYEIKRLEDELSTAFIAEEQLTFHKNRYTELDGKYSELKRQYHILMGKYDEMVASTEGVEMVKSANKLVKLKAKYDKILPAYQSNTAQLNKLKKILRSEGIDVHKLWALGETREVDIEDGESE